MTKSAVIELSHVSKSYRRGGFFSRGERFSVLSNVVLSVAPHQCVGVIGPSGTGKSTLGRLMLGLEEPDSGSVSILGHTVNHQSPLSKKQRRAVQVVFQNALDSCNPRHRIKDILAEPLRNFDDLSGRQLDERIVELLQMVGLDKKDRHKYPSQFSGGQLQRICIARALAPRPSLILLDEAVSALDMVVQAHILDLLDQLRHSLGTAYLFVTHEISV